MKAYPSWYDGGGTCETCDRPVEDCDCDPCWICGERGCTDPEHARMSERWGRQVGPESPRDYNDYGR